MNRRDFLRVSGATGLLAGLDVLAEPALELPMRLIPEDKGITPEMLRALRERGERRVYRGPRRFALGMPCGGIAAGQLYVLGDGTLGGWHVDGRLNATGYGSDSYKVRPHPRELAQGFTLLLQGGDAKSNEQIEARLADSENGGAFDDVEFVGEYPIAEVRYRSPRITLPVDVTLRAGSPFIPLNAKDSCLPCTLMRFTLKNTTDAIVHGHLVGHLENGIDKPEPGEIAPLRRNRVFSSKGLSMVTMEMLPQPDAADPRPDHPLFDFDGPHYDGWTVKGQAFGSAPAKGTFPTQQNVSGFEGPGLVNSYNGNDDLVGEMLSEPFTIDRHFLSFLIGGGSHAKRTCVNLLVDGKVIRTATGRNEEKLERRAWDVRDVAGKQARFQIVDAQRGPWGHINVDSVRLVDRIPETAKRPQPQSLTFGTLTIAAAGTPIADMGDLSGLSKRDLAAPNEPQEASSGAPIIGAIAVPFSLGPRETRDIAFAFAWNFPNLHTGEGVMYSNWFKDAGEVAAYVFENFDRLTRETELFRKTWYEDATLPWWLVIRLFMPVSNLATGTAQWWKNGRFWGWEGVGCCEGTCTHVWNYSHAEARLFPELARTTRTMQDLGSAFEEATGRVGFRGDVNGGAAYAGDGQSGTVLKCYREHLCSADDSFLRANWPRIKKVLDYQVGRDAMRRSGGSGEPDGIIEVTQHNTFDINFEGPNTFVGSLYLAALLAGAQMAEVIGDHASAATYRAIAAKGRDFSERNLFRNGYFIQRVPEGVERWQYGEGCLADQLFGQNWSRCVGLGTVYDEAKVSSALRAVYRHNWSPAVGQYNAKFPPERWFADGREGGLFVCTWPVGGRAGEPVRYRDEVWTGCEYQAAGGMAWEGLVDEALVIVKAIDERYDGATHNPWNEVECGDHYSRAMASYGVFQALCGFSYDGPAGEIGIAPRIRPEDFAAFFSGAEGWGLASQKRQGTMQVNRFEVRWGKLRLTSFTAELPGDKIAKVAVTCGGKPIGATITNDGSRARIKLDAPIELRTGESAEVSLAW